MNKQLDQDIQKLKEKQEQLQQQVAVIEKQEPKQKVLLAIAKQKYFYLKEYPNLIFDRDTSYLWPEKELDVSNLETELTGKNLGDKDEVKSLLSELKKINYLKTQGWEIPAPFDFQSIIDKTTYQGNQSLPSLAYQSDDMHFVFKYQHNQNTILNKSGRLLVLGGMGYWSSYSTQIQNIYRNAIEETNPVNKIIYQDKIESSWYIEFKNSGSISSSQFFLVNKSFAINEYLLDPSFSKLSEKEQEITLNKHSEKVQEDFLQVLIQNKFVPIFDNHKTTPLYDLLLNDLPKLEVQLKEVNAELEKLKAIKNQQRELLSSKFNYQELLKFNQFDCQEIDKSLIRFAHETIRWCGLLQEKVAEYQIRQHKLITEGNAITRDLSRKRKVDSNLSETEKQLLENRQTFMFERLNMDMNIPIANLASMKLQCLNLKKKLFRLNSDDNGLVKLGQFSSEPRASFDLVAENSATMLTDALMRIEFYQDNSALVNALIHAEKEWTKDFKAIKSVSKEKLKLECEEDDINETLWSTWFTEWTTKRWLIEQCLQPLIEKGIEGAFVEHNVEIPTPLVINLVELLTTYRNKVDDFYLSDRKSIHQKFAFQDGGELQEKFEAESELYKHTIEFQTKLHDIVFGLEKVEERLWLFSWGDTLVDMAIDTVLDFIRDKELDSISQAVIGDFTQLRLQNYSTFINDAKAHAEMSAKWDKEYNSLMFKMRKELSQKSTEKEG
ncbi:hypothetical protein [Shewanella sp. 10N.286.48.B5]|uniref:hypothetical protein n=1 Tax=Shewanella sp. 10N.286.48.B5 TaxID=1880834 RepID=UPI000C81AAB9|nr:hypothetical protein [Shewanella sp. 10N.286.48.B5]PMH88537.1 hypothetical protein BCU57_19860 [Shewanella sp. 10N.286.48.B5]